jgi:hypothetical protein
MERKRRNNIRKELTSDYFGLTNRLPNYPMDITTNLIKNPKGKEMEIFELSHNEEKIDKDELKLHYNTKECIF